MLQHCNAQYKLFMWVLAMVPAYSISIGGNCCLDNANLVVAKLKVKHFQFPPMDTTPVAAKEGMAANQIERSSNGAFVLLRHHQQHMLRHCSPQSMKEVASQVCLHHRGTENLICKSGSWHSLDSATSRLTRPFIYPLNHIAMFETRCRE